jgi:hypothetical protein
MTEATFDEMDPVMGNRANVLPPLTFNRLNTGYPDSDVASVRQNDSGTDTMVQGADETDAEGSQRGKKKRRTRTTSANELLDALKQKWEEDKEAEAIIRVEENAAREWHLNLMERNTEACCSIAEYLKAWQKGGISLLASKNRPMGSSSF